NESCIKTCRGKNLLKRGITRLRSEGCRSGRCALNASDKEPLARCCPRRAYLPIRASPARENPDNESHWRESNGASHDEALEESRASPHGASDSPRAYIP